MILADTSIGIFYFRIRQPFLRQLLEANRVAMHPCVAAELALGSLQHRAQTLALLDSLPMLRVLALSEIRRMIKVRKLWASGIGLTDAHLLAACLATPGTLLWTADAKLAAVAEALKIRAPLQRPGRHP